MKPQLKRYQLKIFQNNEDAEVHSQPTNRDSATEQDTVSLVALHNSTSAVSQKVPDNLPMTVQRIISAGFARLQDPQPEGLFTRGLQAVKPGTNALGLLPILTLTSTFGMLLASFAYYLSQYGGLALELSFLPGLLIIFVPNMMRL